MQIQKRTMNWLPRPSMYAAAAAARQKQRAQHDEFLSNQTSLASAFSTAQANELTESVNLASKVALARIQGKTA